MPDGGGGGAGSGGSVGGIGAEPDAVGTGFGVDAESAADANAGIFGTLANALNPMNNPEMTALGYTASQMGFAPVTGMMTVGSVMEAFGGEPDSAASGSGEGSAGDPEGPSGGGGPGPESPEGGGPLTSDITDQGTALPTGHVPLQFMPEGGQVLVDPTEPVPIEVPTPESEPTVGLSDSEEADRLRRARRYFGLGGTNITGPLGLQTPAPVFRPSATPIPTGKRKLGA